MLQLVMDHSLVDNYESQHQHPLNKLCHLIGVPMITISWPLFFFRWRWALALFVTGWILQFVGHAFEHKEPEFFHDWRFLLVGVRWWWAKLQGKA